MSDIDVRLAATAAAQHGLLHRRQVLAAGGTDSVIRRRIGSGRWERCGHGVYAIVGVPWTWRRRLCAVWLSLDAEAMASHCAASKLLAVGGDGEPPYELTVPTGARPGRIVEPPHPRPTEPEVIVHESLDIGRCSPVLIDGIAVTPPSRLAVDLGAVMPTEYYRITVARLQTEHGLTWTDLERTYRDHSVQGRNGCGALRDLLDLHHETIGAPDEVVEMLLADILRGAGLPTPVHQFHVQRPDGSSAFFDLAYPEHRVGIEAEGQIHLRADVHQRDHERRNQLLLAGWIVLHFTYADVTRRPHEVVKTIRAALDRHAATTSRRI